MFAHAIETDDQPFHIDVTKGCLVRGEQSIDLPPKAFSVLRYLTERPGQLVSKSELLKAIWSDVHVEEAVLKVAVCQIRKALADTSREPRFIETAHRRGYRFIGKVESVGVTARSPSPPNRQMPYQEIPLTVHTGRGRINIVSEGDSIWTKESSGVLASWLAGGGLLSVDGAVKLPAPAVRLLERMLDEIGRGEAVTPAGVDGDLANPEAA